MLLDLVLQFRSHWCPFGEVRTVQPDLSFIVRPVGEDDCIHFWEIAGDGGWGDGGGEETVLSWRVVRC